MSKVANREALSAGAVVQEPRPESLQTPLEWCGGIENLLTRDLLIVDEAGKIHWHYPKQLLAAGITWWNRDTWDGLEHIRKPVIEHHAEVSGEFEVVGLMNGVIDLVKPKSLDRIHNLTEFWHSAAIHQAAHTENLPNMKAIRKERRRDVKRYCVVSRGVAVLAHYEYQELGRLLVPAMAVELPDGEVGYRALMPAHYLFSEMTLSY